MFNSNPLIARDRRKKTALKSSKIMRRIVPFFTVALMSVAILMNFCFADPNDTGGDFFSEAFTVLEILIILIGAGLALWGIVNLLEGYGNDNPGAKSQGIKQLMSGAGIILLGVLLVPALRDLFFNDTNNQITNPNAGS